MSEVFEVQVQTGSVTPIFRQIVDQISVAVARGALTCGDPLPSVRGLAERLVVNPNTVAKAYAELLRDGVIESHQGKGVFVARQRQVYTKAEKLRRLAPALEAMVNHAVGLGLSAADIRDCVARKLDDMGL